MDAAAGRRRGGAEVDPARRRAVRDASRPEDELAEIHDPAVDVAAEVVAVVRLEIGRQPDRPGEDELPESRREPLHLRLDRRDPVERRSVRDVAVRPGGVLSVRRACRVEEALLREQHERARRSVVPLGPGDLVERRAEMHGRRAPARLRPPRNRARQRPIDLEGARTVPVAKQPPLVARGQSPARETDELARHHVAEDELSAGQLVGGHRGSDRSSKLAQPRRERLGKRRASGAWKGPTDDVAERDQRKAEARARPALERQHRVRGVTGEEAAGGFSAEARLRERARRTERRAHVREGQAAGHEPLDGAEEGPHHAPVGRCVGAELRGRVVDAPLERDRGPVVERVGASRRRLHPADHDGATHSRTVSFMFPTVPRAPRLGLVIVCLLAAFASTGGGSAADVPCLPDASACTTKTETTTTTETATTPTDSTATTTPTDSTTTTTTTEPDYLVPSRVGSTSVAPPEEAKPKPRPSATPQPRSPVL